MSFLLRPMQKKDFDFYCHCSKTAQHGITSLPHDEALLRAKLEKSLYSFSADIPFPKDELYLFVLEDLEHKRLAGVCGITSHVGVQAPFYSFRLTHFESASPSLGLYKQHAQLHLSEARKGPTEICSLFLLPEYRNRGLSRLLSFGRFLFIKAFPERFHPVIVAEMRGVSDAHGDSPFWDAVMRPFFDMPFAAANLLRAKEEGFIADLIPRSPLYVDLLSKTAQEVIGKCHPLTAPALKILQSQGFVYHNEVDIFDAGPNVYAATHEIRVIKESKRGKLKEMDPSKPHLISNTSLDFRATIGTGDLFDKESPCQWIVL